MQKLDTTRRCDITRRDTRDKCDVMKATTALLETAKGNRSRQETTQLETQRAPLPLRILSPLVSVIVNILPMCCRLCFPVARGSCPMVGSCATTTSIASFFGVECWNFQFSHLGVCWSGLCQGGLEFCGWHVEMREYHAKETVT